MLQTKNIDSFTKEELPTLQNSNYLSFRVKTPESNSFIKRTKSKYGFKLEFRLFLFSKRSKPKKNQDDYDNFMNSEIPVSHRNIMVSNYKFAATLVKSKESGSQIKANFPQIKR